MGDMIVKTYNICKNDGMHKDNIQTDNIKPKITQIWTKNNRKRNMKHFFSKDNVQCYVKKQWEENDFKIKKPY